MKKEIHVRDLDYKSKKINSESGKLKINRLVAQHLKM